MKRNFKKSSIILIVILITFFTFFDNVSALTSNILYPFAGSKIQYKTKGKSGTRYFRLLGFFSVSDEPAFCLEPKTTFNAGTVLQKTYQEYRNLRKTGNGITLTSDQMMALSKISTYSIRPSIPSNADSRASLYRTLATQALYWEIITGERTTFKSCNEKGKNCTPAYEPNNLIDDSFYSVINANASTSTDEGKKIKCVLEEYNKIIESIYGGFEKASIGNVFKVDPKESSPIVLEYDKNTKTWTKTIYDGDAAFSYWSVVKDYPDYITVKKESASQKRNLCGGLKAGDITQTLYDKITITSTQEIKDTVKLTLETYKNPNKGDIPYDGSVSIYTNKSNPSSQALFDIMGATTNKYAFVTTEKNTYGLKITKKDEKTGNHLSGATFQLCTDSECNNVIATDSTWRALATMPATFLVDNVGTYYYREIEAPEGYILNDEIYEVELTYENAYDGFDTDIFNLYGNPKEVDVSNTRETPTTESTTSSKTTTKTTYYQLKIKKIDSVTKAALSGVQFRICSDSNCRDIISTKTTDKNGEIIYDGLTKTGIYYIKEYKSLEGYISKDTFIEVNVTEEHEKGSSNYAEIIVENTKKTYGFNLTKNTMDENGNVTKLDDGCNSSDKSAAFTIKNSKGEDLFFEKIEEGIYKPALSTQEGVTKEIKTCDGAFSVEKLTECEYTITETKAPSGVTLPSNPSKKVNVCGSDKNISFTNGFTGLEFQKKDEDGNFIAGGKFVLEQYTKSGWVNKRVKGEQGVYTYSETEGEFLFETDDGIAYISELPAGKYRIVEKEAPTDYELIEVSDVPEITISDEQKDGYYILTLINRKINKYGSDASAELVITITTGRKVLNYVLIVSSLAALLVIAIIIRKRIKK